VVLLWLCGHETVTYSVHKFIGDYSSLKTTVNSHWHAIRTVNSRVQAGDVLQYPFCEICRTVLRLPLCDQISSYVSQSARSLLEHCSGRRRYRRWALLSHVHRLSSMTTVYSRNLGISAAYALGKAGHNITVVDKGDGNPDVCPVKSKLNYFLRARHLRILLFSTN